MSLNNPRFDVAIVGGGLIGLLTAFMLREQGRSVAVLEKNACGQESSWAGGGILSPLYPWKYSAAVNQLARWSQQNYREFIQQLYSISGIDAEWTKSGILLLDESEFEQGEAWAAAYGTSVQRVGPTEHEPVVSEQFSTGLLFDELAQVRNPRLLSALKSAVQQRGVSIFENAAVEGFKQQGEQVQAVQSVNGQVFDCQNVVVCGGAWSQQILGGGDTAPKIEPVQGQMLLFKGEPGFLSHIVMWQGRYAIPRRDGHILFGSTVEHVGFDKQETEDAKQDLLQSAAQFLPGLTDLPLVKHWAGLRPSSPNGIPYICRHPAYSNLYINSGHYRNGVVLGLASARLLCDLLCRQTPILDLNPYDLFGNNH